jgi:Toxin SymE, type I toxin-antitoxin system
MAIAESTPNKLSGPTSTCSTASPVSAPCSTARSEHPPAPSEKGCAHLFDESWLTLPAGTVSVPRRRVFKLIRNMTVSYLGGRPMLRLLGLWLGDAGFSIGTRVRVDISPQRLVVEAIEPEPLRVCENLNCPHETKTARRLAATKRKAQQSWPRESS